MLDRQHGQIIFECDTYGDTLETEHSDFADAKRALDTAGWRARKIGSDWIHACDKCAERN